MTHNPLATGATLATARGTDSVFIIPFIKIRQFIILTVDHIINRAGDAFFCPQVACAAMPLPGFDSSLPNAGLDHFPRGIGFEGVHYRFRLTSGRHDAVDVIGSHVDRPQHPVPIHEERQCVRAVNTRARVGARPSAVVSGLRGVGGHAPQDTVG